MSSPQIYLSLSKRQCVLGETIRALLSGLLPPLPYTIFINNKVWKTVHDYCCPNQFHDYTPSSTGVYEFYAQMQYPYSPTGYIESNHISLVVLDSPPPNGNGDSNPLPLIFAFIVIFGALFIFWRSRK